MSEVSVIFVTAGSEEEASVIAGRLVEEKLVACVNIVPRIRSIYSWKGEIHDEAEALMIMKTRTALFPDVKTRVSQLHGYEVPEIISIPIDQGLPEYLRWVVDSTRPS